MTGSAVSEPAPCVVVQLGGALEQARVQIEHVARIGFAARRAAQQQRHLAVGDGLLGEVVIDDHGVHAVVAEVLAHGAAGERRQELHRRRLGGGGGDDDRVVERAVLLERLDELGDGRALLADGDVDAVELLASRRCPALIGFWLRMVSRAMAVLPVWRSPMISSRWPRPIGIRASMALRPVAIGSCTDLRGMMPGALTSTRRRSVDLDRALAVDRVAERVDDAAEQALADRHVDDGARCA